MKKKVLCVIMGGGRGTRLFPLTKSRCKPAVPLGGKYRLVDIPISNCLHSGLSQIYVLSQFKTASLHKHIQSTYKFDYFSKGVVDILAAEQTDTSEAWYQGTADAVRQNLDHFEAKDHDLVVILSGDQLYKMNIDKVIEHHEAQCADITIAAKPMPKSEVHGLGVMRVEEDFSILEFVEKPKDTKVIQSLVIGGKLLEEVSGPKSTDYCLASMGIYIFNFKVLRESLENNFTDFGKEVIPSLLGEKKMVSYIFNGYWEDIGTVKAFFDANLMLTDDEPQFDFYSENNVFTRPRFLPAARVVSCKVDRALIGDGCLLKHAMFNRCVLGVRSIVNDNTILRNVVMMGADEYESEVDKCCSREVGIPAIGIGRNCLIENAIIDKNARIGNNVRLSPEGKADDYSNGDIYVRDGILVVTKNAIIRDNTII